MRISIEQLRALFWIARLGSFQGAAKKLNLTQPAVSHRLKELEQALGVQLVERGERHTGVRLTAEGTAALSYSERLLRLSDEMVDRLQSHDPLRGTLRLGAPDGFALVCLGELLRLLQESYPALNVELTVANSTSLNTLMSDRKLDICFISEPDVARDVTLHYLGTIENAWFGSTEFAKNSLLHPRDLLDETIITNPMSSRLYVTIERWFHTENLSMPAVSTCDNLSVIRQLVREGAGIAVLPTPIVAQDLSEGTITRLDVRPAVENHRFYVAYNESIIGHGTNIVIGAADEVLRRRNFFIAE